MKHLKRYNESITMEDDMESAKDILLDLDSDIFESWVKVNRFSIPSCQISEYQLGITKIRTDVDSYRLNPRHDLKNYMQYKDISDAIKMILSFLGDKYKYRMFIDGGDIDAADLENGDYWFVEFRMLISK